MITAEQLAVITIRRVIFHDVPNASRSTGASAHTLSEVETEVNLRQKTLLQKKLVKVIGSRSAYPLDFDEDTVSSVPNEVRLISAKMLSSAKFVAATQQMAKELFAKQLSSVSPGLLCVIDVAVNGLAGVVLMKLERHEGAQLKLGSSGGKKTFSMSVLEDLVLTDGTRLFKAAMFLRTGPDDYDFTISACDSQVNVGSSDDLAKFWIRFLGCRFTDQPRVTTQKFFDTSKDFINNIVTDPLIKSEMYDALQSELRSQKKNFSPRSFIEEYVPEDYRELYQEHLTERNIRLTAFEKDTADIAGKLRRRSYQTRNGAVVSIPEDQSELVVVGEDTITVNDAVLTVR